ncbi:hypothetical protein E4U11_005690 [Claviceps purpurea]|nr:hypothetical protein E4U11_005690 [Claviceps purpurea]
MTSISRSSVSSSSELPEDNGEEDGGLASEVSVAGLLAVAFIRGCRPPDRACGMADRIQRKKEFAIHELMLEENTSDIWESGLLLDSPKADQPGTGRPSQRAYREGAFNFRWVTAPLQNKSELKRDGPRGQT